MAVRSDKSGFGGSDYTFGEKPIASADANDTNDAIIDRVCPIGGIIAWAKTLTNVPALPASSGFVECDGSVISDSDSPMNGETLPDLNGDNRFMRGNTTSGDVGGEDTSTYVGEVVSNQSADVSVYGSGATENRPVFYNIVWLMRIK